MGIRKFPTHRPISVSKSRLHYHDNLRCSVGVMCGQAGPLTSWNSSSPSLDSTPFAEGGYPDRY